MTRSPLRTALALSLLGSLSGCDGGSGSGGTDESGDDGSSTQPAPDPSSSSAAEDSTTLPPLPDPSAGDDGPTMPSQSTSCKVWVACAMATAHPDVRAIIDEYGSLGTCWVDSATAAACDAACSEALQMAADDAEAAGQALPDACDPPRDVPYSEIVAIVDAHCVDACHEPGGEEASLDLSTNPRTELLGVVGSQAAIPHVTAGEHEASYAWHKVSGTQGSVGGMGVRMPAGQPALSPEQIEAIADWIDIGAPP